MDWRPVEVDKHVMETTIDYNPHDPNECFLEEERPCVCYDFEGRPTHDGRGT